MAKAFEEHRRWAPSVPKDTCPDIDSVIADMERLRGANASLRELALFWREAAEQLATEVDELRAEVSRLERENQEISQAA
jgi:cob(I)alamin adenosyltransferase